MVILENETFEKYGYYPRDLKPKSHKRVIAACDECGKIRDLSREGYKALCKSCAKKGEKNNSWRGGKLTRKCKICGKKFTTPLSVIKQGHGIFCSHKCRCENMHNKITKICPICGKLFTVYPSQIKKDYGIFCSTSCAGKSRVGKKHWNWKGGELTQICKTCGKPFSVPPSNIKKGSGRFCSNTCAAKARRHNARPKKTHLEIIFEEICKKHNLPFRFVGDGSFWIGNANPDFIHKTRKVVCEVFGDYWHSPLINMNSIRNIKTVDGRRAQLKKEGYKLIVLWETDLKREDAEAFVLATLEKKNNVLTKARQICPISIRRPQDRLASRGTVLLPGMHRTR